MTAFKPLVNKKFGSLLVLSDYVNEDVKYHKHWCNCLCDCGLTTEVESTKLTSGNTKTCGKCASVQAVGRKFGRLTVVSTFYAKGNLMCNCVCDCHKNKEYTVVYYQSLLRGTTKSCGCYRSDKNKIHGMVYTRFYGIWSQMKGRCYRPKNPAYKYYGGRGITVCDRWKDSFENFKEDMYEYYQQHIEEFGEDNTTIDRINVDGNYELNNCKWATRKEQSNNTRNTIKLTHNEETHSIKEWSRIYGIKYLTAWYRYKHGWKFSKIFSR